MILGKMILVALMRSNANNVARNVFTPTGSNFAKHSSLTLLELYYPNKIQITVCFSDLVKTLENCDKPGYFSQEDINFIC